MQTRCKILFEIESRNPVEHCEPPVFRTFFKDSFFWFVILATTE